MPTSRSKERDFLWKSRRQLTAGRGIATMIHMN